MSIWICTGVIVLVAAAFIFWIGKKAAVIEAAAGRVDRASKKLEEKAEHLDQIPVIKGHLQTLLDAFLKQEQRLGRAFPELQSKVDRLNRQVFPWESTQDINGVNGSSNGHGE